MSTNQSKSSSSENKKNNAPVSKEKPENSDKSAHAFYCKDCDVDFPTESAYEGHLEGKKHFRKSIRNQLQAKKDSLNSFLGGASEDKPTAGESSEDKQTADESSKADADIFCEVCKKTCSGYIPYKQHLISAIHHKNLKKEKLKNMMKDRPEIIRSSDINSEESDDDLYSHKVYARCDTCEKDFYAPEALEQHKNGVQHKKKAQIKKMVDQMKASALEEAESTSEADDMFSYCKTCEKNFSGPVPYKMHMNSAIHKKALVKAELVSQIKDQYILEDDMFLCKDCKKPFNNPKDLKRHINSNDHEKQKAKEEMKQFLIVHPEILMVKALDDPVADDNEFFGIFFMCKICKVSLTSLQTARSHVISKKHKSMKSHLIVLNEIKGSSETPPIKVESTSDMKSSEMKESISDESDEFEVIEKHDKKPF